jgi:hypothetical protein
VNGQGRVAWRWIWCWLSVLVVGCGPRGSVTTLSPPALATFPGYTRVPPTWTPVLRVRRTLTPNGSPSATLITSNVLPGSTPLLLMLDVPTCSETPVGSLWCVGLIRNTLSATVSGVIVRISLVTIDGTALAQQEALSARPLIRPGEWSPYGALFSNPPAGFAGPVAELIGAEAMPPSDAGVILAVENLHDTPAANTNPAYHVQATITNQSSTLVRAVIVVTLFNSSGQVGGFREIAPDTPLAPGVPFPLDLDITPLTSGAMQSVVIADGLPIHLATPDGPIKN